MAFVMAGVWFWATRIDNYSIVDPAWSLSFVLLVLGYAMFEDGAWIHRALTLLIVGIWSLRLGLFLVKRVVSHHPKEDNRYTELRNRYSPQIKKGFFEFFQIQGLSVVLLSIPFLLVCRNGASAVSPFEFIGIAVWFFGVCGESIADVQMNRFKADPSNRGKTCQRGLWNYSRHPNYFFESMIWWGFFIFALGSPGGWISFYCPLGMLYILLKVTGVPFAEEQALKSRGEEYRRYQKTTSEFIPWFRKDVRE